MSHAPLPLAFSMIISDSDISVLIVKNLYLFMSLTFMLLRLFKTGKKCNSVLQQFEKNNSRNPKSNITGSLS